MGNRYFTGPTAFQKFTEFLAERPRAARIALEDAGEIAADSLYDHIVRVFGDTHKLAPLAASTQKDRQEHGFAANMPLFRTGALLLSHIEKAHKPGVGAVGSKEMVQKYSELGFVNARSKTSVPPRPVFRIGLEDSEPDMLAIAEAICGVALGAEPTVKRAFLTARSRSFNFAKVRPRKEGS